MVNLPAKHHVLTIALEDYFHGPAFRNLISRERWNRFEARFERNCLLALDMLEAANARATFFVRGWVAQNRPDLIREVVARGHEIASAGNSHKSFLNLSPEELRADLRAAREMIENASGRQVQGYRVSDPHLRSSDLWGLEVLAQEGYLYDSSLSPAFWAFRKESWRRFVHQQRFGDRTLWEFPLSSYDLGGLLIPIAGGNYFRQFPEKLVQLAIEHWDRTIPHPFVTYFRLWDLDPMQPKINSGSLVRDIRHYRNADRMIRVIENLLKTYRFQSIADTMGLTAPEAAPAQTVVVPILITSTPRRDLQPVSIVVPCYNEESSIPYLANTLRELRQYLEGEYAPEFVFVDDGSKDRTWELLQKTFGNLPDCKLLRHERNQGVSAAIQTGIRASGEIVCSMDCDCTYDPREIKGMIPLVLAGADLVTASPYHPEGKVLNVPWWRLAISRTASSIYRGVTGRKLYTFTACLRAYRRSAVLATPLEHSGFLGVAELISKMALQGAEISEYPATLEVRIFGQSKMKIARTSMGHFRLLAELAQARWKRKRNSTAKNLEAASTPLEIARVRGVSPANLIPAGRSASSVLPSTSTGGVRSGSNESFPLPHP